MTLPGEGERQAAESWAQVDRQGWSSRAQMSVVAVDPVVAEVPCPVVVVVAAVAVGP